MKFKNIILGLLCAALTFASFEATAQIKAFQIEDIPDGFVLMGVNGTNQLVRLDAIRVNIDPVTGITSTTVQGALAELQGDINASGDGWGADVVSSDATLSGDGAATPLAVVPANINTGDLNNDAGFINGVTTNNTLTGNGAGTALAIVPANIATSTLNNDAGFLTGVTTGATITGNGAGSPLSVVQSTINTSEINNNAGFITSADLDENQGLQQVETETGPNGTVDLSLLSATTSTGTRFATTGGLTVSRADLAGSDGGVITFDATGIADDQTLTDDQNTNILTLQDGGTVSRVTAYDEDVITVTGGASSVTLPRAVTNLDDVTFTRNGIIYKASTTNGAEYLFVSGSTLQPSTGRPAFENGEDIGYKIPK